MDIKIPQSELKSVSEHYELTVEIRGKTLIMDTYIENGQMEDFRESHKTNVWNLLTLEEKFAVQDEIEYYFSKNKNH